MAPTDFSQSITPFDGRHPAARARRPPDYSYAVSLTPTVGQQYLYTPSTGDMQIGLKVSCYWSLINARRAAPRGRM